MKANDIPSAIDYKIIQQMEFDEIKKQQSQFESTLDELKKERELFSIKTEFEKLSSEYVKKSELDTIIKHQNREQNQMKENQNQRQRQKQQNVEELTKYNLTNESVKQLEEWTSLQCGEILFDTNIDNWSKTTSVFNERIIGKSKLAFVIKDEDGEIFGYYFNTQVIEKYWKFGESNRQETDIKSFKFNLQSKNNRLDKPMKFEIKDLKYGGIVLVEKSNDYLIWLGNIGLCKENKKKPSKLSFRRFMVHHQGLEPGTP